MRTHRSFLPKLLILFGVALAFMLYFSKRNLKEDFNAFVENVNVFVDNISYSLNPERSKSISTLEKETNLKYYVGEPFISFRKADWDKFWDILYGIFPVDYSEDERVSPRARQLKYAEMESRLKEWYPNPFSYFQEQHWQQFWQIIFGKKMQKR